MTETAPQTTARLSAECVPSPDPLPVSTVSKTKNGVLHVTFARPDNSPDIKCRVITVVVPIGTADTDLASDANPIEADYSGDGSWLTNKQMASGKVTFTCTPEGPGNQIVFDKDSRFTLTLSPVPVTRAPGRAALTITATTAVTDDWENRPVDSDSAEVVKHLETIDDFFFRNFSCEKPQVNNGQKVVLRWEGSDAGTEYWLSWDDAAPVKVTGRSKESHELTETTTFVLDARTKDATGKTVNHYLSTTVTVKNPDIKAKTLTATDRVTVTDTFTADNKDGKKTWARATTFEGDVVIAGKNTLKVGGMVTAEEGVTVPTMKPLVVDTIQIPSPAGSRKQVVFNSPVWIVESTLPAGTPAQLTVKGSVSASGLVSADGGVTVPTGKAVTANGGVTIPTGVPLKVDTIEIPSPAGSRKQVVFNSPVWIQDVTLPAGTPAHLTVRGSVEVTKALKADDNVTIANGKLLSVTKIKSTVNSAIELQNSINQTAGDLTTAGAIKRGGQAVVAAGDSVSLESLYFSGQFLNGSGKQSHSDNSGVSGPAAFYRSYDGASKFKIAHR